MKRRENTKRKPTIVRKIKAKDKKQHLEEIKNFWKAAARYRNGGFPKPKVKTHTLSRNAASISHLRL